MRKFYLLFFVLIGSFFATENTSASGNIKVAVVDMEKIVKEMPEAIEADKKIQAQQQLFTDSLASMKASMQQRYENYMKQQAMMPVDEQKKEEEAIMMMQQELTNANQQFTIELKKMSEQLVTPILTKVNDVIKKFAKKEKINLVLKKDINGSVVYFDDALDITFDIIIAIKKGK